MSWYCVEDIIRLPIAGPWTTLVSHSSCAMSIARIEFNSRPDAGAVERRRHPVGPVAAPSFDYRSMLFICRMSSCGSPVALLGGLDDGLQVIPLDLAVQ